MLLSFSCTGKEAGIGIQDYYTCLAQDFNRNPGQRRNRRFPCCMRIPPVIQYEIGKKKSGKENSHDIR